MGFLNGFYILFTLATAWCLAYLNPEVPAAQVGACVLHAARVACCQPRRTAPRTPCCSSHAPICSPPG